MTVFILGKDNNPVEIDKILEALDDEEVLHNKPKFVIIQACRGGISHYFNCVTLFSTGHAQNHNFVLDTEIEIISFPVQIYTKRQAK